MLRSLVKEPLTHFLALALIIFVVYVGFNRTDSGMTDRIVITGSRIEQLVAVFAKTWQRSPTAFELKGLIDDYIKEEIYYREALALGLDKDDAIIRRRLRIKMQFLNDAEMETVVPTDTELDAYLEANPGKFELEPMMAFQHIYLNPESRRDKIVEDADSLLKTLLSNVELDPDTVGDVSLLPSALPMTGKTSIAQIFGREFSESLNDVAVGRWTGPVKSAFGLHIVRVIERKPNRIPSLGEVRDLVNREWLSQKRKTMEEDRFNQLLKRYQVRIERPAPVKGAQ